MLASLNNYNERENYFYYHIRLIKYYKRKKDLYYYLRLYNYY